MQALKSWIGLRLQQTLTKLVSHVEALKWSQFASNSLSLAQPPWQTWQK